MSDSFESRLKSSPLKFSRVLVVTEVFSCLFTLSCLSIVGSTGDDPLDSLVRSVLRTHCVLFLFFFTLRDSFINSDP